MRILLAVAALALTAAAAGGERPSNGKIAFWSDLGPAAIFVINSTST